MAHQGTLCHQLHPDFPTPTGRMPGCLPNPISQPDIRAQYAAQGGQWLAIHSVNNTTVTGRAAIDSPKRNVQCCRPTELVPPGPAPPDRRRTTSVTVSAVRSRWTCSRGRPPQASKLSGGGFCASGCFAWSTPSTGSPVFVQRSRGWHTPSFS